MVETLEPGESSNQELTLSNGGQGALSFTASIQQTSGTFPRPPDPLHERGSGGPDAFGYRWRDSDETNGPVYQWVEIRNIGTALVMHDNTYTLPKALGFSFSFYGTVFSSARISSNGFISFNAPTGNYDGNDPIPSPANPNNIVAAFWDDLDPGRSRRDLHASGCGEFTLHHRVGRSFPERDEREQSADVPNPSLCRWRIVTQYKWVSNVTGCSVGIENGAWNRGAASRLQPTLSSQRVGPAVSRMRRR
jgi:hypothetical protein